MVEEEIDGFGGGAALELGFDVPGHGAGVVGLQEDVVADGVDVFGVYEEAVHVEEACSDWREATGVRSSEC